ncbi:hypothetical protein [Candidatus Protofrankia californiensis]|uniref:hypothetical protein n=1 Tax=Candidatus Protofrankia californiensis TaxID=1839754 RepID=UPI0010417C56|nr:hypothetical protein [Candidatus Protofrankia californiensis]
MYLRDSFYVLTRRWYVVLPLFVFFVVTAGFVARATPYSYTGKATVVLLSPSVKLVNEPTASNPFLAFSGNLSATATVLMRILTDEDAAQKLVDSGATATYTVGPDPMAPGAPLLVMEAKDADPAVAARTMDVLIELLKSELKEQQTKARAPADVLITATVVSHLEPGRSSAAKKKAIAGGAAVALVVPMLTAFAVEGAAFRRARRRAGDPDAGAQTPAGAESSVEVREPRYNEQPTVRTTVDRAFRSDPSEPSDLLEPVAGAEFPPVRTSTASGTTGRRQATGSAGHEADWDGFVELETSEFSRRMLPKQ